jgi:hypothetical protein
MDITLNQNGSGTIALEYRISKSLDSLGKLDGNERWNTIPVGKADFERTIDRLPEMKLLSFSSREEGQNTVISVKMEFGSLKGLMAFLDAGGRRASFSGGADSGSLVLTLGESAVPASSGLAGLLKDVSDGYLVELSMSFPGEGTLSVFDSNKKPVTQVNRLIPRGKKVSLSLPLFEILSAKDGINAEFKW